MKYWSKSALSIYKYLPTMVNTLDKIIMDTGKSSHNSILQKYQSTYCQASKIIELIDRKRKMINLKIAVEDTLNKLDRNSKRLLTLIFIDGAKSEVVAEMLGMSIRTFFRKKISAINEFSSIFQCKGYDNEFFESEYSYELWFMSVYNACVSKSTSSEDTIDKYIIKQMVNEASQISYAYNVYV